MAQALHLRNALCLQRREATLQFNGVLLLSSTYPTCPARDGVEQRSKTTEYSPSPSLTPSALSATTSCNTSKQHVRPPLSPSGPKRARQKTSLEPSLTTRTISDIQESRTPSTSPDLAASGNSPWLASKAPPPSVSAEMIVRATTSQQQSA
jgi:hypothetical protein